MASRIGIVIDSAADFPEGIISKMGIHVVPVHIIVEGKDKLHGVGITNQDVVNYMHDNIEVKTIPPLPNEYSGVYEYLSKMYDQIISFHVSSELSNSFISAKNSLNLLPIDIADKITVVDTKNVSVGQGLIVKRACELLANNRSVDEIPNLLDPHIKGGFLFFMVENLYWLKRAGKLNIFSSLVGSMLDIKPIITLSNGKLIPIAKRRGKLSAIERTIQLAVEGYDAYGTDFEIWIAHADADDNAYLLKEQIADRISKDPDEIKIVELGPTLTAHMGPGGLCLGMMPI